MKRSVKFLAVATVVVGTLFTSCESIETSDLSTDELELLNVSEEGYSEMNTENLNVLLASDSTLGIDEIDDLVFMLEEEKLAHDVYTYFSNLYDLSIFNNIAESEYTHMSAVKLILDTYEIPYSLSSNAGEFFNEDLQVLYNDLVEKGAVSVEDALFVGATIEEIDIIDLMDILSDELSDDLIILYENLLKGSRNHLRAFIRNIENHGVVYEPSYLDYEYYIEIIQSDIERGQMYCSQSGNNSQNNNRYRKGRNN